MAGRASYSAHMPIVSGPEPAVATNAVGRSPTPPSTENPPPVRASAAHADERSSSNPSSGWACTVWESSTKPAPARPTSAWAAALGSMPPNATPPRSSEISYPPRVRNLIRTESSDRTQSLDLDDDVAGAHGVAGVDLDG